MALYIDKIEFPEDMSYIPSGVLQYVIEKHNTQRIRLDELHNAYMGKNFPKKREPDDASVVFNYPRYIVDTVVGMYLGDPIKYNSTGGSSVLGGVKTVIRNSELMRADRVQMPPADISVITDAFKNQSISDADVEIGRDIGEYGEAYELEYASDDETPMPKTTVCSPRSSVMVRDTSVEHHKIFFMTYEKRERIDHSYYYAVFCYTATEQITYYSDGVDAPLSFNEVSREPHFFGEVPAVEYRNNSDRLGDFETVLPIINAYNELQSDRLTDKKRFVNAVLLLYGMSLTDEQKKDLKRYGLIDTLPSKQEGAAAEYVQKVFDENSVQVLADNTRREIFEQSMTVDMTDAAFGTASGVALKSKLLTMNMLVKNKVRSMERGLRKRFEMYNHWLMVNGRMPLVSREDVDIVFNVSLPVDEPSIINTVTSLQGFVDDETLLSLLWFVKNPQETLEKVKAQKKEAQAEYMDTFGMVQKNNAVIGASEEDGDDETDADESGDGGEQGKPGTAEIGKRGKK